MTSHALHHDHAGVGFFRWLLVGFAAGFLATLAFNQGAFGLLHLAGVTPRLPFSMEATPPFGVPQVISLAFWGGIWGLAFAMLLVRWEGAKLVLAATVLGAILPTLVAWFVVAPLEGQPVAAGWMPLAMTVGPIINAAWGLGTGLGLALFGRPRGQRALRSR